MAEDYKLEEEILKRYEKWDLVEKGKRKGVRDMSVVCFIRARDDL